MSNDASTKKKISTHSRKEQEGSLPSGEVIVIQVPSVPRAAINKERSISSLIKTQLEHLQHAQNGRLPKHKRLSVKVEEIRTEAEASRYIQEITRLLHPEGKKRARAQKSK